MVIDTSALLAIVFDEPEGDRFAEMIQATVNPSTSAVSVVEASISFARRHGRDVREVLAPMFPALGITVEPFTLDQSDLAIDAYLRYGKTRHKAGLNFGDCCVYALAKSLEQPLLFKGNDFIHTDIEPALA